MSPFEFVCCFLFSDAGVLGFEGRNRVVGEVLGSLITGRDLTPFAPSNIRHMPDLLSCGSTQACKDFNLNQQELEFT